MNIRKIISAYKTKILGQKPRFVPVKLLGADLILSNITINKKNDKDDAWWYALAQNHQYIFDIGANVGYSTLLATLNHPNRNILLADPNADALAIAKTNLELNLLGGNKQYINCFISDKSGEQIKFYTLGAGAAGSMFSSHADSAKVVNAYRIVQTLTIDDIVEKCGYTPELVKIDVEAAESYVLKGSRKLAAKQITIFFVEMHGPDEMPMVQNAGLVLDWCAENSYTPYYLKDHIQLTSTKQIAHRGRCHLLLLPKQMEYPEYLKNINEGDDIEKASY